MRIERLSLDFFGRFSGKVFDFGARTEAPDFHLIYGSNEAGKTTTMEGYLRLLYGFPHREPYAFQHQRQNLRVSGVLEVDGEARVFQRLPSRNGNLRGASDAALPEAALAAHLGGLSLEDYRSLLCLDDDTIEKGGEDIASARGDIGRLLFSAAAGVADLNAVLDKAREEAGAIYRKRAKNTRVAELKRELTEIESAIRQQDVGPLAWQKLKDALENAQADEAAARGARDALRIEQAQVAAMRRALPDLHQIDQLAGAIAGFADYPERLDINPEDLVTLRTERGQTEAAMRRLVDDLDQTETARAALTVDTERLALGEQLDALDELRSRAQTAELDLPRRHRARDEALSDMVRVAQELGVAAGCDVTRLVVAPADIAALDDLRETMRAACTAQENGQREIDRLESGMEQDLTALQALLDEPPARTGLLDVLRQFDADALAPAVNTATQAVTAAETALAAALDALSMGACIFATLPDAPADPVTAAEMAERHADLTSQIARLDDRLARLGEDRAAIEAKIARFSADGHLVGDDEAQAVQARRDALWQTHRAGLTAETADSFKMAMAAVDDLNAARLARASDLGEMRKLAQDQAEAAARAETGRQQRDTLSLKVDEIENAVHALCAPMGLPALSPAAFADWLARHAAAATASRQRDRVAAQHRETLDLAERLRRALEPLVALETPGFDATLLAARRLAEIERAYADKVRAATDRTTAQEKDLERRRAEQVALEARARQSTEAWQARVETLFSGMLSANRLAAATAPLRVLREHDAKRLQAERQVSTMQEDQRRFAETTARYGARFGIAESDPFETFRRLRAIADQAGADKARHDDLVATLEEGERQRATLAARLEDIDRQVAALGTVFPVTVDTGSIDTLRHAVGKGLEVIANRERLSDLRRQVLADLSLESIDEARALLADQTAPSLDARLQSLASDNDLAEQQVSDATVARANAARDLAAITDSAEIAELVQQRATLQMQLEETVLDYLERDFGLRLADEAIRRYRDAHRSEMMAATERAFADLTNGAYRQLQTQPEGASEILLAVDASGTPKQIGDMSKGTRFQLYLALRAAAYEQMATQGVQLPFFCDDVFETFDEDRTCAACRLMERIGRHGQAIYLTHHRHVIEIAQQVCDATPRIHYL